MRAVYRAHLSRLVDRVNSVTGVRYADDPDDLRLGADERVASGVARRRHRAPLVDRRDGLVHQGAGIPTTSSRPASWATRRAPSAAEWLAVCRLPTVDYCDSHLYAETTDRVTSRQRLQAFIDDRVQLARHVAHKPIVFGEFGFHTDGAGYLDEPRAAWFSAFLERAIFDGAAGALAWIYQPWFGRARDFGIYVDRADTDDVRATMRKFAAVAASTPAPQNPLLGDARGDALLYDPYVTETALALSAHGRRRRIEIPPSAFVTARWERLGTYGAGPDAHAYGGGDGWFDYSFTLAHGATPTLEARLSSEWPGNSAPPTAAPTSPSSSTACASPRSASSPTTASAAPSACRSAACARDAIRCASSSPPAPPRTACACTATRRRRSRSSRRPEFFARAAVRVAMRAWLAAVLALSGCYLQPTVFDSTPRAPTLESARAGGARRAGRLHHLRAELPPPRRRHAGGSAIAASPTRRSSARSAPRR